MHATRTLFADDYSCSDYAYGEICMYVCMCQYAYGEICTYVCMYVCANMLMARYVRMYVCMYVCANMLTVRLYCPHGHMRVSFCVRACYLDCM